jgi:hypothetical protein
LRSHKLTLNFFDMKKVLYSAAIIGLFSLSSCKKDYSCDCEVTVMGQTTTSSAKIEDSSNSDAKEACDAIEAGYKLSASIGGGTANCELN